MPSPFLPNLGEDFGPKGFEGDPLSGQASPTMSPIEAAILALGGGSAGQIGANALGQVFRPMAARGLSWGLGGGLENALFSASESALNMEHPNEMELLRQFVMGMPFGAAGGLAAPRIGGAVDELMSTPPVLAAGGAPAPQREKIIAAALRTRDGKIIAGKSHGRAFMEAGEPDVEESGLFITSFGRLVDREEAERITGVFGRNSAENMFVTAEDVLANAERGSIPPEWTREALKQAELDAGLFAGKVEYDPNAVSRLSGKRADRVSAAPAAKPPSVPSKAERARIEARLREPWSTSHDETVGEWIARHKEFERTPDGKLVMYHATPKSGGATNTLRSGSLLESSEEAARFYAARDRGLDAQKDVLVFRLELDPTEFNPGGTFPALRNDFRLGAPKKK